MEKKKEEKIDPALKAWMLDVLSKILSVARSKNVVSKISKLMTHFFHLNICTEYVF